MSNGTDNLVLEHLRHIRGRVDSLAEDMRQVKLRLGVIEGHIAATIMSDAGQNVELDRVKERLDRIERRLELAD